MPSFIQVKTDVAKYTRQLRQVQGALAATQVATVNAVATAVHNKSGRNLQSKMILRNQYTMRSLKLSKARVRSSGGAGYAEVGSVSPYLPLQETGGTRRARRSRLPIPTTGVRKGGSKRGVVLPGYRFNRMGKIGGKGAKFFYANLRKPGIYTRRGKRLIMARDISRRSVRIKPTHWHTDAVKQFGKRHVMEQVFIREAKKRLGLIR